MRVSGGLPKKAKRGIWVGSIWVLCGYSIECKFNAIPTQYPHIFGALPLIKGFWHSHWKMESSGNLLHYMSIPISLSSNETVMLVFKKCSMTSFVWRSFFVEMSKAQYQWPNLSQRYMNNNRTIRLDFIAIYVLQNGMTIFSTLTKLFKNTIWFFKQNEIDSVYMWLSAIKLFHIFVKKYKLLKYTVNIVKQNLLINIIYTQGYIYEVIQNSFSRNTLVYSDFNHQ